MKKKVPNPGSDKAIGQGCCCPILDNARGKGAWGTCDSPQNEKVFWTNINCPLHGQKENKNERV